MDPPEEQQALITDEPKLAPPFSFSCELCWWDCISGGGLLGTD